MDQYLSAMSVMRELFSKDYQFAMATCKDNVPSLRYVDTFYDGECFYIATYAKSQKVLESTQNPNVALCARRMHAFSGIVENIGHPLSPTNKTIRDKITVAFSTWYFAHNNENDKNMCYLRIRPTTGFFHKDGIGYKVDFEKKTVVTFPFSFTTVLAEE